MNQARRSDALRKRSVGLSRRKHADDWDAERAGDVERARVVSNEETRER